jgi:hypothetical protein
MGRSFDFNSTGFGLIRKPLEKIKSRKYCFPTSRRGLQPFGSHAKLGTVRVKHENVVSYHREVNPNLFQLLSDTGQSRSLIPAFLSN